MLYLHFLRDQNEVFFPMQYLHAVTLFLFLSKIVLVPIYTHAGELEEGFPLYLLGQEIC